MHLIHMHLIHMNHFEKMLTVSNGQRLSVKYCFPFSLPQIPCDVKVKTLNFDGIKRRILSDL